MTQEQIKNAFDNLYREKVDGFLDAIKSDFLGSIFEEAKSEMIDKIFSKNGEVSDLSEKFIYNILMQAIIVCLANVIRTYSNEMTKSAEESLMQMTKAILEQMDKLTKEQT